MIWKLCIEREAEKQRYYENEKQHWEHILCMIQLLAGPHPGRRLSRQLWVQWWELPSFGRNDTKFDSIMAH